MLHLGLRESADLFLKFDGNIDNSGMAKENPITSGQLAYFMPHPDRQSEVLTCGTTKETDRYCLDGGHKCMR